MLISKFMTDYSEKDIPFQHVMSARDWSCSKYTTWHIRSNVTRRFIGGG
jgi:hypothetical protein